MPSLYKLQDGFRDAYKKIDNAITILPGGGTGIPGVSDFIRPAIESINKNPVGEYFTDEILFNHDKIKTLNEQQQGAEAETLLRHHLNRIRKSSPDRKPELEDPNESIYSYSGSDQTDLYDPDNAVVNYCSINRDSYNLAQAAKNNYRINTQDTPEHGILGCVESVQRNLDTAGIPRIKAPGWKGLFRDAANVDELREQLLSSGRGYSVPVEDAQQGDLAIKDGNHAVIVSDIVDDRGVPLYVANSGSRGTFSDVDPVKNKVNNDKDLPSTTTFEVFRFGKPPSPKATGRQLVLSKLNNIEGKMIPGDPTSFRSWNWTPEERNRYENR